MYLGQKTMERPPSLADPSPIFLSSGFGMGRRAIRLGVIPVGSLAPRGQSMGHKISEVKKKALKTCSGCFIYN